MEKVNLKTKAGVLKVAGVALCMAGVLNIAFVKGFYLKLLLRHHLFSYHGEQVTEHVQSYKTWVKGVFLLLLSNTSWALWLVLQGLVLRSYPSKLLSTTLQCFFSAIQSFVLAIALERHPNEWKLGWDVKLLSVAYCGIVVTGVTYYLQAWVIEKKGPVFLAMTTPMVFVFTIILSVFLLGEMISFGSLLGALLLVGGLYCVLWGKSIEQKMEQEDCGPKSDLQKVCPGSDEIDIA